MCIQNTWVWVVIWCRFSCCRVRVWPWKYSRTKFPPQGKLLLVKNWHSHQICTMQSAINWNDSDFIPDCTFSGSQREPIYNQSSTTVEKQVLSQQMNCSRMKEQGGQVNLNHSCQSHLLNMTLECFITDEDLCSSNVLLAPKLLLCVSSTQSRSMYTVAWASTTLWRTHNSITTPMYVHAKVEHPINCATLTTRAMPNVC